MLTPGPTDGIMSRHERLIDHPRSRGARGPSHLTIDTPNSTKTVTGQTPSNPSNASRTMPDRGNPTPKFMNNSEEIFDFIHYAQEQLRKRISETDLRQSIEQRIQNLRSRQLDNDRLQTRFQDLETQITNRRAENVKLKKSIDVYKNMIYQDNLELKKLDDLNGFFETRKFQSPFKLGVGPGLEFGSREHRVESANGRLLKREIRLEPPSREKSKTEFKNDTPSRGIKLGSFDNSSAKLRLTKRAPAQTQRSQSDNLDGLVAGLKKEVSTAVDPEEIIQRMGQVIDYFQIYLMDKMLNQNSMGPKNQSHAEEGSGPERSLSRKFDFQSIRENSETSHEQPRVSIRQFKARDSNSIYNSFRMNAPLPFSHSKLDSRNHSRVSSKLTDCHVDIYREDKIKKQQFHSSQNSNMNISFGPEEEKIPPAIPRDKSMKNVGKRVDPRRYPMLRPNMSQASSLSKEPKQPPVTTLRPKFCLPGLAPINERFKTSLCSERGPAGAASRRHLFEARKTSFQNPKLAKELPPPHKSSKSSFTLLPFLNASRIHNYKEHMAEKKLKFEQNVTHIDQRYRDMKIEKSRTLIESLKRQSARSREKSLTSNQLSDKAKDRSVPKQTPPATTPAPRRPSIEKGLKSRSERSVVKASSMEK